MASSTPTDMERWINGLWHGGNALKCGLYGERVPHWPFFSNQEYVNGGGCRNKESRLIFLPRHGHIELLKREAILLYCLFRALKSWTRNPKNPVLTTGCCERVQGPLISDCCGNQDLDV